MALLMNPQLEAFLAVIEEGSFERASVRLCITPSALSQRIKALEDRLGTLLIVRQTPTKVTKDGEKLLRRAKSMALLEEEALSDYEVAHAAGEYRRLSLVINNDSLSTWITPAISEFVIREQVVLDIEAADESVALERLKKGLCVGVVTAEARAPAGCKVRALGAMEYAAVASPHLIARYLSSETQAALQSGEGLTRERLREWANMPVIHFGRDDALQYHYLSQWGLSPEDMHGPAHYMPGTHALTQACEAGLGWNMAPIDLARESMESGRLQDLCPSRHLFVPLYWQTVAVKSELLDQLSATLIKAASQALYQGKP